MLLEFNKDVFKNINTLKDKEYKRKSKNSKFFLESKGTDVFFIKRKVEHEDFYKESIFSTNMGVFYSEDSGEFGGQLYKVEKRNYIPICPGNIRELIDLNDKLFFINTCAHMLGRFSLGFIWEDDSKYYMESFFEEHGEYCISAELTDDEIFILTNKNIYSFDLSSFDLNIVFSLEEVGIDYLNFWDVGNTLIRDKTIYIGLADCIAIIDLETGDTYFKG